MKAEEIINFPTEEEQLTAIAEHLEEQSAIIELIQQPPQGLLPVVGWIDNFASAVLKVATKIDEFAELLSVVSPTIDKYKDMITKSNEIKAITDLITSAKATYEEVKPQLDELASDIRAIAQTIRDRVNPHAPAPVEEPVEEVFEPVEVVAEEVVPTEETESVEVESDSDIFDD